MTRSLTLRRAAAALLSVVAIGATVGLIGGSPQPAAALASNCTVFVSPAGGGNGTAATSPTTLGAARSASVAGNVICLKAGTYAIASNFIINRSGTSAAPITYRAYGDGTPLLQYTGGSLSGGVLQTNRATPWAGTHDVVIDGLTIDGANLIGGGIFVTNGSHHITIRNCTIRNTGATGIALNATDYATVDHNLISHVGYNQGWSSGISLWYGGTGATYGGPTAWYDTAAGFHNVIADNVISGAYDNSINHSDGNGIIVDGSGAIPPALIVNNLVYENGGRGIESLANSGNLWIVNNTAYANGLDLKVGSGQAPDFMAHSSTNVHLVNNVAYSRKNGSNFTTAYAYNNTSSTIQWRRDFGFNGSTPGVSSSTLSDPAQYRSADPRFAARPPIPTSATPWRDAIAPWDIATSLTLASGSPAIDAGTDPATLNPPAGLAQWYATDLAGNARVSGLAVDAGAYESGTITPPLDTTPPQVTITDAPADSTSKGASVSFSADEPATFECALDGDPFAACSSPKTYTGLALGSHTVSVRATDTAGNGSTPVTATWKVQPLPSVDNAAPSLSVSYDPNTGVLTATPSTVKVVDLYVNGTFTGWDDTAPYTFDITDSGTLALRVVATQADGDDASSTVTVTR